jgi:hypothetical protein
MGCSLLPNSRFSRQETLHRIHPHSDLVQRDILGVAQLKRSSEEWVCRNEISLRYPLFGEGFKFAEKVLIQYPGIWSSPDWYRAWLGLGLERFVVEVNILLLVDSLHNSRG